MPRTARLQPARHAPDNNHPDPLATNGTAVLSVSDLATLDGIGTVSDLTAAVVAGGVTVLILKLRHTPPCGRPSWDTQALATVAELAVSLRGRGRTLKLTGAHAVLREACRLNDPITS